MASGLRYYPLFREQLERVLLRDSHVDTPCSSGIYCSFGTLFVAERRAAKPDTFVIRNESIESAAGRQFTYCLGDESRERLDTDAVDLFLDLQRSN